MYDYLRALGGIMTQEAANFDEHHKIKITECKKKKLYFYVVRSFRTIKSCCNDSAMENSNLPIIEYCSVLTNLWTRQQKAEIGSKIEET